MPRLLASVAGDGFTTVASTTPIVVNDWISALETSERARGVPVNPPRPVAGLNVTQNPPAFTWPLHKFTKADQQVKYTLQIQFPGGTIKSYPSDYNWFLPRESFAAGNYAWRVIGVGLKTGGGDDIGGWRSFSVAADAMPLFDDGKLTQAATDTSWYNSVATIPHPRVISDSYLEQLRPLVLGTRVVIWNEIKKRASAQATDPAQAPPHPDMTQANWVLSLPKLVTLEQVRIEYSAIVWRLLRGSTVAADQATAQAALADLKARTFNLAGWDTQTLHGQDSNTDTTVRNILWALAVSYDHLYPVLTQAERDTLVNAIAVRASQVQSRTIGPFRTIERNPMDSHAATSINTLAAATAIMAGEMSGGVSNPQFNAQQFGRLVPLPLALQHSFGGDDGAWGNGGGYGEWDVDNTYPYFDALTRVTGASPFRTQKVRNNMVYQLYARPAGGNSQSPFGDGAVIEGNQVKYYAYWFATRVPSTITNWMATVHPLAANHDPLVRTLLSPPVTPPATSNPGTTTTSKLFESVGQVAMHSSLTDANRTSVHFKSSPTGSYSHSHADQNHFTIMDQGKALLIDSGYYDYYLSPHAKAWYRQTKAHNAITYDGGTGQRVENSNVVTDYTAVGQIIGYHDGGTFTIATGDATKAYDNATVTRARRTVVYLKSNLLLVHDDLAASRAVNWEWNFHAKTNPQIIGGATGTVKIVNGTAQLCMKQLAGNRYTALAMTDRFPVDPTNATFAPQYHGTWSIAAPATQQQSVMLIDIGCKETTTPAVTESTDTITVTTGGKQFRFTRNGLPAFANAS
ncbi:MAG TPA: heparinase II/III family protein [Chitinolyticbacter sp.]|nr:heparinase II/III family protein [Chitinolyticbacter sp.]